MQLRTLLARYVTARPQGVFSDTFAIAVYHWMCKHTYLGEAFVQLSMSDVVPSLRRLLTGSVTQSPSLDAALLIACIRKCVGRQLTLLKRSFGALSEFCVRYNPHGYALLPKSETVAMLSEVWTAPCSPSSRFTGNGILPRCLDILRYVVMLAPPGAMNDWVSRLENMNHCTGIPRLLAVILKIESGVDLVSCDSSGIFSRS